MKTQQFQFFNPTQFDSLNADPPTQAVVPDWYTYSVTAITSKVFPGHCAITIMAARDTPTTLEQNKLVKGSTDDGLAWAENHLTTDVHPDFHLEKSAAKEI